MSTKRKQPVFGTNKKPTKGKRPDPRASVRPGGMSKKSKTIIAIIAALVILAAVIIGIAVSKSHNKKSAPTVGNYTAVIDVKDYGKITVELDGSAAPATVQNFVSLAESGFYDGLTFHRIMEGFMIQGGDPEGTGGGGSDKNVVGEFPSNGYDNPISHTRGTISMARRPNDPNSASSQFFIVQEDSIFLDGDYAAFGHVTEGMEVVDAICADAKPTDNNGTIPADQQPVINSITISAAG